MKKALSVVLAATMALSLVACGGGSQPAATTAAPAAAEKPADAPADAPAGGEVVEQKGARHFDLSTTASPGSALDLVARDFAEEVKIRSNGNMIVDVYDSSALGSEAQNLEALTAGTLDMAIIAIEFYSNSIPELGALILPFQYENYDQVQEVLTGEAGQFATQRLRDAAKVQNLGYYVMMFRNMYLNKPINTVDDLAGVKIRVPESALYVNTMKMMGAAPTPMAFGEIYTSCETGVIDGFENTLDSCYNNSMFEVLDYLNVTNHINAPTTFSMSAQIFDSLTAEEQQILLEAGEAASLFGLDSTKNQEADFLEKLSAEMEIVETDVATLRDKIDYNNYDFMASDEAKQLFDLVQATVNK